MDPASGSAGGETPVGAGTTPTAFTASLVDLVPNGRTLYRVVATNGFTTVTAGSFLDAGEAPPLVTTDPATAIGYSKATLNGSINPLRSSYNALNYRFDYGPDTGYGKSWTTYSAGCGGSECGGFTAISLSGAVVDLAPSTIYHYRLVVLPVDAVGNSIGPPSYGPDRTFTTVDGPPVVSTVAPVGVTASSATLRGTADGLGYAGTSRFYVTSPESPDTRVIVAQDLPAQGSVELSAALTGLAPGTSYRVRAAGTSAMGTRFGDEVTFTTTGAKDLEVPAFTGGEGSAGFGCGSPRLDGHVGAVVDGGVLTLTGADLGVGGEVSIGGSPADVRSWSAGRVEVVAPSGLTGPVDAVVDCGRRSNALALQAVSNAFSTIGTRTFSAKGGTLRLRLPGAGQVSVSGADIAAVSKKVTKGGVASVRVKLISRAHRRLLRARSHTLQAKVRITFRPTGASARTTSVVLRFKQATR